ncbi:MAG: hypothetical protein ACRD3J_01430 [Thermoanaerobaculia bacterium]
MRKKYNLAQLKNPVRGKHYARSIAGTNVVLLDPDVVEAFPDAKAVNDALRALLKVAQSNVRPARRTKRPPA